ncbi:MAG: leucine-rich repeat protein [Ruminococcus sp.]|nr:leucine-rich repeat protein [Ruminococcus sp.]
MTSIENFAFEDCRNITSITIPKSVTYIGSGVFSRCSKLESVTLLNPECEIYNSSSTLGDKSVATIYGYENSTAQAYAEKYGYNFSVIGTTSTTTPPVTTEPQLFGDINNDGYIDAVDAALIMSYYAYVSTDGTDSFPEYLDRVLEK